jgi:apolipoprotein N-acyltransferase
VVDDSSTRRLGLNAGFVAAAASGVMYALAQPNWGIWPLAGLCMVPLFRALAGASNRRRILLAYITGSIATAIATAVSGAVGAVAYFGMPLWAGALCALAIGQFFGAGSFVLFAVLAGDPSRSHPALASLRVGAAWAAAEFVRSQLFTGLPWLLFGYALVPVPELAQSAVYGGVFLVSLWLAAFNSALARALRRQDLAPALATALGIAVCVAWIGIASTSDSSLAPPTPPAPGAIRTVEEGEPTGGDAIRVRAVQASIPDAWRRSSPGTVRAMEQLVELSGSSSDIDLVIWPENAVSALLPLNEQILGNTLIPLGPSVRHLIVGAPRADPEVPGRLLTSAFLIGPDRQLVSHHDKVHRLPFAEYTPWPFSMLGLRGPETSAGTEPTVLVVGAIGVGPLICYEVLFPELTRRLVRDGAQILVNLSNDAWFGSTGAVAQHLAGAVFRAIETRRPMLRSTNTGITVAIDAQGRIVARLPMNTLGALEVEVTPNRELTPYVRTGDIVAWGALLGTGAITIGQMISRRRLSMPRAAETSPDRG